MLSCRVESFGPLRLVGLTHAHSAAQDKQAIFHALKAQWTDYLARRPESPNLKNTFGVFGCMADGATHFDYFCGAPSAAPLPLGFAVLKLPLMRCAAFACDDPVLDLRDFVREIFAHQLPAAGLSLLPGGSGAPEFIERYGADFNRAAMQGRLEVLVPVQG